MERYGITDRVKIQECENGISLVTVHLPSYMVADLIEVADIMLQIARWMRHKTYSSEAEYLAKRFHALRRNHVR